MRLRPKLVALFGLLPCTAIPPVQAQDGERPIIESLEAPALTVLASRVAAGHPEIMEALATLEARSANRSAADRPLFNPELGLELEDSAANLQAIGITQTIDIADERAARLNVADYEYQAARAGLADARRQISAELLSNLANYSTAVGLDELAETRIELMETFLELTRQRQQAGDLTQVELNIANLAASQAEIEHASAESAMAGADQSLRAIVTSQPPATWPALPEELPEIATRAIDVESLLMGLPEARVAHAEAAAAEARIDLRQRERRAKPTVGLTAGTEEDESLVGLTFSMPLNVRNRFTDEVAAARAERSAADQRVENTENRARRRIMAATERFRLTRSAWYSWLETGQPNLGQQSELLERLVEAGELSTTDYLVQLNQTLDTAASAIELRHQLWLAWIEWLTATSQTDVWLGIAAAD